MTKLNTSIHGGVFEGTKMVSAPFKSIVNSKGEISRMSRRAINAAKQARCRKNKAERARVNMEFRGEAGSKRAAEYHQRLKSLALGTW